MAAAGVHISVCICTYKRANLLENLLKKLQVQKAGDLFTYSIIVVDNDADMSAKDVVGDIATNSLIPIQYYVEPERNIALARNKAVQNVLGDYVAFIDDDEFPENEWLWNLFRTCNEYKVDGVLGPVKPQFEKEPPEWIIKGKLCERPTYETGKVLEWYNTRTGNVLLRRSIFNESGNRFNQEFRHSEDQDFFRRMTEKGHVFIWCDEAKVYEIQTPDRFKKDYFIRRALLRGNVSLRLQSKQFLPIAKSAIAFSIYTLALPFLLLIGQHIFVKYLIKDFDHIGRLMAALGFDMQKYLV